jgi:hypothetical protein
LRLSGVARGLTPDARSSLAMLVLSLLTVALGVYMAVVRPPLLPEDVRFLGVAPSSLPPSLLRGSRLFSRLGGVHHSARCRLIRGRERPSDRSHRRASVGDRACSHDRVQSLVTDPRRPSLWPLGASGRGLRCRDRERTKRRGQLICVELGASGKPVLGGEFGVAILRPVREQTQDFVEVLLGVDSVEAAGRDCGEDRGGTLSVSVAAVEHPIFSAYDDLLYARCAFRKKRGSSSRRTVADGELLSSSSIAGAQCGQPDLGKRHFLVSSKAEEAGAIRPGLLFSAAS